MSAVVADIDMAAEGFGSAIHEFSDDAPMALRHGFAEPIQIGTAVAAQNVCHLKHQSAVCGYRSAMSLLIVLCTCCIVAAVRCT